MGIMNYFVKRQEFFNQNFPLLKTKDFFFYNVPSCFDIETSSFYDGLVNGEPNKVALMYEWTFNINNKIIVGRTVEDYINIIKELHNHIYISKENLFPIYVHNLKENNENCLLSYFEDAKSELKDEKELYPADNRTDAPHGLRTEGQN